MARKNKSNPQRQTPSLLTPQKSSGIVGLNIGTLPKINPLDHYSGSLNQQKRIPLGTLRRFSQTIPVRAAITKITNSVLAMKWLISAPEDEDEGKEVANKIKKIEYSIKRPSSDPQNDTYRKFLSSVITDLLVANVSAIERAPALEGDEKRRFWLWVANVDRIHLNPHWTPETEGIVPKFFDTTLPEDWVPLMSKDLFLIQKYSTSWEINPPGALEVAFVMVAALLGVNDYQFATTSNSTRENLIDLGETTQKELEAFREFWEADVKGKGKTPIVAGKGKLNVVKIGASNDDGLYLKYTEFLLKMIALAFNLSWRDMNIVDSGTRATAGIAAEASYQDSTLPMAELLAETFTLEAVDYYESGYEMRHTNTEPRNEEAEANRANTLYAGQIFTQNEAREAAGADPLPPEVGDYFINGRHKDDAPQPPPPTPGQEVDPKTGKPIAAQPQTQEKPGNIKSDKLKKAAQAVSAMQLSLFP